MAGINIKSFLRNNLHWFILLIIIFLAVWTRLSTKNTPIILDYDPWWHYRHASELLQNGLKPLKWDLLSFFPPGRSVDWQQGWHLTLAIFYKIASAIKPGITLMQTCIWAPVIMVALTTIPAYLTGRIITNRWGGLATALFAVLTPTFIGVSMAGYPDDDVVVLFYTFLTAFSLLYLLKKRTKLSYIVPIVSLWLFAFSWNQAWYILYLFFAFVPFYWIFLILVEFRANTKLNFASVAVEKFKYCLKNILLPLVIVTIAGIALSLITSHLGWPMYDPITSLGRGFSFIQGKLLIVNVSVAELQPINVFSREGFLAVMNRIGIVPLLLALIGLPIVIFLKFWYKLKINFAEVFAFLWLAATFYLITRGVRFSLLFSAATAAAAGFVVGNIAQHLKKEVHLSETKKFEVPLAVLATIYGLLLFAFLWHISENLQFGLSMTGMEVDSNWRAALDWLKQNADKKSLITTWWDPGHIIAGYTGLRPMADGAHCAPDSCVPYNHNIRIQDMGKVFSTSSEDEAVSILSKYRGLTPDQCQRVKDTFGSIVPAEACQPISDMYVIASSDLIGKYHWLSYFGQGTDKAKDFYQLQLTNVDQTQGILTYANGAISLVRKDNNWVPIYNNQYIIREIVYFENGEQKKMNFANSTTQTIDGMVWVDPSYQVVLMMQPEVRDSIFTQLFFWDGAGLNHFKLVFQNSEVKIFKVNF